ncbi:hypothetical protein U0070_000895 [Myodes glareolus]|uniref:DUF4629 domain-containing protein n=1 Tax=Myodes glareolus TaxID=447135 RepID=A0AAW0I0J8_MYOGA
MHNFVVIRRESSGAHEQDKTKRTRENNFKKTEELKQFRKSRVGREAHHPRTKRRRDPPVLSHHSFKKPQTHPSMYMRQSMKDFHLLQGKREKKTGLS